MLEVQRIAKGRVSNEWEGLLLSIAMGGLWSWRAIANASCVRELRNKLDLRRGMAGMVRMVGYGGF